MKNKTPQVHDRFMFKDKTLTLLPEMNGEYVLICVNENPHKYCLIHTKNFYVWDNACSMGNITKILAQEGWKQSIGTKRL